MLIDDINKEYQLMMNSEKRTIKLDIPNGPSLVCNNCWDYKTNLSETSFKTTAPIDKEHPLLRMQELDLRPVTAKTIWLIRVLRQPESNLKNDNNQNKPGGYMQQKQAPTTDPSVQDHTQVREDQGSTDLEM